MSKESAYARLIMKELSATLKEFIAKQELLRLAYTGSRGYPHVVPVWYVIINNEYYVGTGAASAKRKAVEKDARVGWVIDGGERHSYKGASYYGLAEEVTDSGLRAEVYCRLGEKYFGSENDPKFVEIYGEANDAETVYWRLKAQDVFAWEY
jgi:nitroimidazol reductase NimA-like FMN-containing flavoprotein (pyridoxamine 5'-phosphate oxidase superfamily)